MSTFPGQLTGWMAPALKSEMAPATNARVASAKTLDSSETITALVTEYSATLYRVAYSVMRNAAEAEDAVQEAFLRVLKHRDKLEDIRDHRVWLIRITWNVVLDRKRRGKTRPENDDIADFVRVLPSNDRRADESLISSQEHKRILDLVDRLPRKNARRCCSPPSRNSPRCRSQQCSALRNRLFVHEFFARVENSPHYWRRKECRDEFTRRTHESELRSPHRSGSAAPRLSRTRRRHRRSHLCSTCLGTLKGAIRKSNWHSFLRRSSLSSRFSDRDRGRDRVRCHRRRKRQSFAQDPAHGTGN